MGQIAPNTVGECNLEPLTGEEYYALEESSMYKNTYYCYHVKVGSEIAQDTTGVAASGLTCNEENFSPDQEIGTSVSKVSETEQLYTMGTSQYCKSGNSRQGHLKVSQDPAAKSTTAVVVEKSSCDYEVTVTVPSCGQKRAQQFKDWFGEPSKTITDTVTSSGKVTTTSTTTSTSSSSTITTSSSTTSTKTSKPITTSSSTTSTTTSKPITTSSLSELSTRFGGG